MAIPDPDALAQFQRQHAALRTACEQDPRYHFDAYAFVCECVDYTYVQLGERWVWGYAELRRLPERLFVRQRRLRSGLELRAGHMR